MIGGAEIYAAALPFADELLLTEIDAEIDGRHAVPCRSTAPSSRRSSASPTRRRTGRRSPSSATSGAPCRERPLVGTSGWGYPSWQPGFYPAGLDRSEFLSFYAAQLPTVELNATKYRLPSEEQFRAWAAQVPDGFRFAVKAPDGLERRLATFEERVRCLGDRLGCVRVVVERPRDDGFLELLLGSADPGIRYALDLRDPSWDGVEERLAAAGAVRVDDDCGRGGLGLPPLPRAALRGRRAGRDRGGAAPSSRSAGSRRSPSSATATSRTRPRQRCGSARLDGDRLKPVTAGPLAGAQRV